MPKWFSPNSEILLLATIGFVITVIEAANMNLNANLLLAWKVTFPEGLLSGTLENMIRSVIFGIIVIRGATVHVYLASYFLLIFPVLKERRRILLLIWLSISGFRSILVNGVSTLLGVLICSRLPDPHPACFEFLSVKAVELACSVYMWVLVNDFMFYLRRVPRNSVDSSVERPESVSKKITSLSRELMEMRHKVKAKCADSNKDSDSDESLSSFGNENSGSEEGEVSEESSDALLAKAAVNWFFRLSFGMKFHGRSADRDEELTQKFLKMTPEEVEKLTQKIKQFLEEKCGKDDKPLEQNLKTDVGPSEPTEPKSIIRKTIKEDRKCSRSKDDPTKCTIFYDDIIMPNNVITVNEFTTSEEGASYISKNVGIQTDALPKTIIRIIEKQEEELQRKHSLHT